MPLGTSKCRFRPSRGFVNPKIFLYASRQPMVALRLDSQQGHIAPMSRDLVLQKTTDFLALSASSLHTLTISVSKFDFTDPQEHPQNEEYWGHVNPIGPRACYDEGKRVAETMCYAYAKQENVEVRVARIFNTFGPRMHMNDGRVVSNFIIQSLKGEPITIFGSGKQTRSFQYVSDLVAGMIALMNSNISSPVNLGNPEEHTIMDFANIIKEKIGGDSKITNIEAAEDDPKRRKPDIAKAKKHLKWEPV
ncbi:putative UDP-glucuronic acid decarboxylase 1-like, partial [Apostichopus japonicus]